jgi:phage tail sheath gpL-like
LGKTVADRFLSWDNQDKPMAMAQLEAYLMTVAGGGEAPLGAKIHVFQDQGDGTQATGQIACTRANAAGDTVTVAGVTFTEATSPSSAPIKGEFARGASDTTCGSNLADAINAHPRLLGLLTAASVAGTLTLTAVDKGTHGNLIVMSTSDATAFTLTQFASGAKGTVQTQTKTIRCGL